MALQTSVTCRVFFYHGAADKLSAASHLLAKAAAQGKRVTVFSQSEALLAQLDQLLWTQNPIGFTPHCAANAPIASETPVLLTSQLPTQQPVERLMNLDLDLPPDFAQYSTLIEVVGQAEEDRLPARERFKAYKAAGCEIQSFDLSKSAA